MTLLDDLQALPVNPLERRLRGMNEVRRLVSQVMDGTGDTAQVELTDHEWFAICSHARGAKDEKTAIARVVKEAYRLRAQSDWILPPQSPERARPLFPPHADVVPATGLPATGLPATGLPATGEAIEAYYRQTPDLPIPEGFGVPRGVVALVGPTTSPWYDERPPGLPPGADRTEVERSRSRVLLRHHHQRARSQTADHRRRERWLVVASWLWNIGLIIFLFVAWQLWGTAIAQHHSQADLKAQFHVHEAHPAEKPPPTFSLVPAAVKVADPAEGSVIARLQIPKIALSQYVVSGTAEGDLAKGPGHYLGTAMPGQSGNVAIAGHRTTHGAPFNRLAELVAGTRIYLTTSGGEVLTYVVAATPYPVSPVDVSVLNNFGDNRLTLTTCNPEFSARQRLIVIAAYLPPGASHPAPIVKGPGKPYKLTAVSTGWNMSQLPLVLAAAGALILLGVFFRRLSSIYGRQARWLILVPIWLALLLMLFDALTNVLPSSV